MPFNLVFAEFFLKDIQSSSQFFNQTIRRRYYIIYRLFPNADLYTILGHMTCVYFCSIKKDRLWNKIKMI